MSPSGAGAPLRREHGGSFGHAVNRDRRDPFTSSDAHAKQDACAHPVPKALFYIRYIRKLEAKPLAELNLALHSCKQER